jgi:hypothetical protein
MKRWAVIRRFYFCGMTERQRYIEQLKRDLVSDDTATVVSALKRCRESGDVSAVPALISLYASTQVAMVRQEVAEMLSALKVSGAESAFMTALRATTLRHVRLDLITFMWNSALQPAGYLAELVGIAIEGTYAEALECLTLVESLEGPFAEEQVLEALSEIRKHLATAPESDKKALMREFVITLDTAVKD